MSSLTKYVQNQGDALLARRERRRFCGSQKKVQGTASHKGHSPYQSKPLDARSLRTSSCDVEARRSKMRSSQRVPSVRPDYDYQWQRRGDITELTAALACRTAVTSEAISKEGIDVDLLFLALLKLYKDWFDESHKEDLEFQALLSVAATCKWLYDPHQDKLQDLREMLDEVHHSDALPSDSSAAAGATSLCAAAFFQGAFTREGLCQAVERALGANVHACIIEPDFLEISFTQGDYGEGLFDGAVCLDEYEGLFLLNYTLKNRHQYYGNIIPKKDAELEECLVSDQWRPSPTALMCPPPLADHDWLLLRDYKTAPDLHHSDPRQAYYDATRNHDYDFAATSRCFFGAHAARPPMSSRFPPRCHNRSGTVRLREPWRRYGAVTGTS